MPPARDEAAYYRKGGTGGHRDVEWRREEREI